MLGPLLNPAHAPYGLVGVYSTDISQLMAGALMVRPPACPPARPPARLLKSHNVTPRACAATPSP